MYRSGKYPKTISKYINTLNRKVEAEVLLNTIKYTDGETMKSHIVVISLEAVGITEIKDSSLIASILDRFSKVERVDGKSFENGMLVTDTILDQKNPKKPSLKIGFKVDYSKIPEWDILDFQEAPRY